jgi:hypothetical protein
MINLLCFMGIYIGGCILSLMFFFTGRWPSLLERDWHWPMIFLWPMVVLWPVRWMARPFLKTRPLATQARLNGDYAGKSLA